MKNWKLMVILLVFSLPKISQAQQQVLPVAVEKKYQAIIKPDAKPGWIEFRNEVTFSGENIFREAPDLIGLSVNDEMKLFKTNIDGAGNKHYKFSQYYHGVRIEGIEYFAHERNGKLHLLNGRVVQNLNINVTPSVSKEQSIATVLAAYPAQIYLWEDARAEANFKKKEKNEAATLYPTPELLIVKINTKEGEHNDNYTLAYRMYVFAKVPNIAKYVYVDAHSGEIIRDRSLEHNCTSTTIETTFNGSRTTYTDFRTDECNSTGDTETSYFSIDDCHPDTELKSYYSASYDAFNYGDDYLYCDDDNSWSTTGSVKMVMTSLWSVRKAFDYFYGTYGHESFDGDDGLIDIFNNKTYFNDDDEPHCQNANYTNIIDNLNFGAGNDCSPGTLDDYNTLDIVGHEYTHGIIEYAHFDALDYSEESGALNESFADIFGEMVEIYVEGDDDLVWLMAEDRGAIRSFMDPNDFGDPDSYFGTNWASLDGGDNGGVHTNSSVQNHMFYLLSEGGIGTSDQGVEYNVEAIGYDKARRIAWGAMMDYLNSDDGYFTARNAWIQSAIDLYGSCSQEVISVGQAWQAVDVTKFTGYDIASVCGTYIGLGTVDATYGIENASIFFDDFFIECATTINSTAIINFESGYYIDLHPGFEAKSGSTFTAWIDECEITEYDPDDLRFDANNTEEQITQQTELSGLLIYPVPSSNNVTLDVTFNEAVAVNIYITDVAGRFVANWMVNQTLPGGKNSLEFDVRSFSSGIYFAVIKTTEGIQTAKFVVQH